MSPKKKILVVEDEMVYAKMVRMRLEAAGYEVSVAVDAYQGTQMIVKNDYDLVVLDLMMPAGGGFALLERIRNMPARSTLPVIILTGKTIDDEIRKRAEANEVAAIFNKPYDSKEFLRKIRLLLSA